MTGQTSGLWGWIQTFSRATKSLTKDINVGKTHFIARRKRRIRVLQLRSGRLCRTRRFAFRGGSLRPQLSVAVTVGSARATRHPDQRNYYAYSHSSIQNGHHIILNVISEMDFLLP